MIRGYEQVKLGNVLLQSFPPLCISGVLYQFDGQSDAGQRGPQFVRGVGEEDLVTLHQLLDLIGGAVEACGKARHFIVAFDRHARG